MKRATHTANGEAGFSLTEVLVVSMMLGVILGAAYLAVNTVSACSNNIMARNEARSLGQRAVEQMVRELRMAHETTDHDRFPNMTPKKLTFYADVDHDSNMERVTYTVANQELTRSISYSGMVNPSSSDFGADSEEETLVDADSSVSSVFEYWDGGSSSSAPAITSNESAVAAVKISLVPEAESGNKSVSVVLPKTTASIRTTVQSSE